MLRSTLRYVLLGLFISIQIQTAQAQPDNYRVDSLSVDKIDRKEKRVPFKLAQKLKKAQKKQAQLLAQLKQQDTLGLTRKQLKKLEAGNKEIEALEKQLAIPKVNQEKLLNDLAKDSGADPYLKEYAKYKKVNDLKGIQTAASSTNSTLLKNKELDGALKETNKVTGLKFDSASLAAKGKQFAVGELSQHKEYRELKKELTPYLNSPYLKGLTLKDLDSLSMDSLKAIAVNTYKDLDKHLERELLKRQEMVAFKADMAKMKEFKNLPENYKKQFEQYSDKEYLQKEGVSKAVKEASKYLAQHQNKLTEAQKKLSKLKKKYSSVPNSNDLSTATKRTSLKGKPFKERMVLGANLQLVSTHPLIIDASPVLGYKLDKRFTLAVGATYRARLTEYPANSRVKPRNGKDELTYGYRVFSGYTFWKGFYAHAEYERMSKEFEVKITTTGTTTTTPTDQYERRWVEAALIGVGKSYNINNKIKGSVNLLYNFIHSKQEKIYPSPWVFRFGFKLK